jgi:hypothetical protein
VSLAACSGMMLMPSLTKIGQLVVTHLRDEELVHNFDEHLEGTG